MAYTDVLIGAHPDDIEIGAGGTAARLIKSGWTVYFCILTRETGQAIADRRKEEAREAAEILGLARDHVIFVDLPDTELEDRAQDIDRIRAELDAHIDGEIHLVFSHSRASAHSDHRVAHALTLQAKKNLPILCYPIVNDLIPDEFEPKIFVDISDDQATKHQAISQHQSQIEQERILLGDIDELSKKYGRQCHCRDVEAFELEYVQPTPRQLLDLAKSLSCKRTRFYPIWVAGSAFLAGVLVLAYLFLDLGGRGHIDRGEVILQEFKQDSHMAGRVIGFSPEEYGELKILVYVLTDKWYIHPWAERGTGRGYATIDEDGSWRIATEWRGHQAYLLALLLTKKETGAPPVVHVFKDAERDLLSQIECLTAQIMDAPSGI